jgi:hypothetical protein
MSTWFAELKFQVFGGEGKAKRVGELWVVNSSIKIAFGIIKS